jgi:hypothetical protein
MNEARKVVIRPALLHRARASLMRGQSLRRLSMKVISEAKEGARKDSPQPRLAKRVLPWLSSPLVLPPLAVLVAVILSIFDASGSFKFGMPPVAILSSTGDARSALGLLWQVEGSILALVTAIVLFSFEGLVRSRPGVSVWEYASKSGLSQYIMLGAAGLSAVTVPLFWPSDQLPLTAAHFAAFVSVAGILAFPVLIYQSIRIIDPSWLRRQRLEEVRAAVASMVEREVVERVASSLFAKWANEHNVKLRHYKLPDDHMSDLEISSSQCVVYDIDLSVLVQLIDCGTLVSARLGDVVTKDSALISVQQMPIRLSSKKSALMVVAGSKPNRVTNLLVQLREEAQETLRSESVAGLEEVVGAYKELWLAWPREWARYQQRVAGGFLGQTNLLGISSADDLSSDLWSLVGIAIDKGASRQARVLLSVIFHVGYEAVELDAPDILRGAVGLARAPLLAADLGAKSRSAERLTKSAYTSALEVCKYAIVSRLEQSDRSKVPQDHLTEMAEIVFVQLAEVLKLLLETDQPDLFADLDREFRRVLNSWDIELDKSIAQIIVEDGEMAGRFSSTTEEAKVALEGHAVRDGLAEYQTLLRVSVLGWGLRRASTVLPSVRIQEQLLKLSRSFGGLLNTVNAAIDRSGARRSVLSDWILSSMPTGEAHLIDDDGPLLQAYAAILLGTQPAEIPPGEWMSVPQRIDRLKEFVKTMADAGVTSTFQVDQAAVTRLLELLDEAQLRQETLDDEEIARQPLDDAKVDDYRSALTEAWRSNRIAPTLFRLAGATIDPISEADWSGSYLGFPADLEHKGPFVSRSNWAGAEHIARDYGRRLALEEFGSIVKAIVSKARIVRGRGTAVERVRQAVDELESAGYRASLILVPSNPTLIADIGLSRRRQGGRLERMILGELDRLPVIEWSELDDQNRVSVVDLGAFLSVREGVDVDGQPVAPTCRLEEIDDSKAEEIRMASIGHVGPEEAMSVGKLKTFVVRNILRMYQIDEPIGGAARSMWIPAKRQDLG